MNLETNKILESLFKQQGITEFQPFQKPEKCDLDIQLYAYIKEDKFHICDANLKYYSRNDLKLPQGCPIVICIENNTYSFQKIVKGHCILISSENSILDYHPEGFTEIGQDFFFISATVELPVQNLSIIGYLHKFKHDLKIDKPSFEYEVFKYSEKSDLSSTPELPKIKLGVCLFIKNQLKQNLRYLFSQNHKHVFYNTDDQSFFIVSKTTPYGGYNVNTYVCDYIWISGTVFNFINYRLLPANANNQSEIGSIIVTCNGHDTELKVYNGFTDIETISTEYPPFIKFSNDFFVTQFFHPTYLYQAVFCIVINQKGEIIFSRFFENQDVDYENNLLSIKPYNDTDYSLNDCYGNKLATIYSKNSYPKYENNVKVEININRPSVFNESDVLFHHLNRSEYKSKGIISRGEDFETTYQGLIELHTGRTMIPLNFSGVITKQCAEPFSEAQYKSSKQVSIVWIDHYFETEKSYYGLFLEDKLILPIFYDYISFLNYNYNKKHLSPNQSDLETNFVLVKRNDLYGLFSSWGTEILSLEAEYIEGVGQNENTQYVKAYREDRIKLIYRDKIISGYDFLSAESVAGDNISDREEAIRVSSEEGYAFIYQGCKRTSFYDDISIHSCYIFKEGFVFIVTQDSLQGLLNSKGEVIIPIEHENIVVRGSYIKVDGIIYGYNMTQIINTHSYEFFKGIKFNGVYVYLYKNETEVVLFGFDLLNTKVLRYAIDKLPDESEEIMGWKFDFKKQEFESVPEEDNYPDYPDEPDYYRDTYYALGGDDYDAFIERGGSLDDMMDGMVF